MDNKLLTSIGLTDQQSKTYMYLVENGANTPPVIARSLNESRTNTYNVLEKLTQMGLVKKFEQHKKFVFQAEPPTVLQKLTIKRREDALQQEQELQSKMSSMLAAYFQGNEKPGVRFFQGEKEVKQAYKEQNIENQPVFMIRPHIKNDLLDFSFLSKLRHKQRELGIWRHAITPDQPGAPKNYKESDPFMLVERTWMDTSRYTAPVEWAAYGNKLTIYSFGNEAMAMTIDSPQVADAFRQLFELVKTGLRQTPDYNELPKKADYMASTKDKINTRTPSKL